MKQFKKQFKMSNTREIFANSLSQATLIFRIFGLQYFTLTSSSKRKDFCHQDNHIPAKLKINFFFILAFISLQAAYLIYKFELMKSTEINDVNVRSVVVVQQYTQVSIMVFLVISLVHSYLVTPKTKLVFRHCEEIANIFEKLLAFPSEYDEFRKEFKKIYLTRLFLFIIASLVFILFLAVYKMELIVFTIFFELLPYAVIEINLMRFVFFITLVNHNIQRMKLFVEHLKGQPSALAHVRVINLKPMTFLKTSDFSQKIISLKDIYGLCWEMTGLINSISGPSIAVLFFLTVFGNTIAGYKIFLKTKDDIPTWDIGSIF